MVWRVFEITAMAWPCLDVEREQASDQLPDSPTVNLPSNAVMRPHTHNRIECLEERSLKQNAECD